MNGDEENNRIPISLFSRKFREQNELHWYLPDTPMDLLDEDHAGINES